MCLSDDDMAHNSHDVNLLLRKEGIDDMHLRVWHVVVVSHWEEVVRENHVLTNPLVANSHMF